MGKMLFECCGILGFFENAQKSHKFLTFLIYPNLLRGCRSFYITSFLLRSTLKGGIFHIRVKMKLTNTKIYDTIKEVIGEDSIKIIEYLKDKKNISDFK